MGGPSHSGKLRVSTVSLLDTSKLQAQGIILKDIETRLREILPQLKENLSKSAGVLDKTKKETEEKLAINKNLR